MAVLTAKGISRVAIELLQRSLVLPRTLTLVPGDEFAGDNGDTITLRVPQPSSSRTQASAGAALTADDVSEVPQDVQLSHIYHLKNISDQELSMQLEDFAGQVTKLQVGAVSRGVEGVALAAMNALSNDATIKFALAASDADTIKQMNALRETLTTNEAPAEDRFLAASPQVVTRLLTCSQFVKNNESGSSDPLRNASVGRIFGIEVVEVTGLTASTAVAYHKSGFALAIRQPVNPKGATSSSAISAGGIGLRQVFQYNAATAQDQSLVSTFAGAKAVFEDVGNTSKKRFIKTHISAT